MLKPDSYVKYLEAVVLSLLAERKRDGEIWSVDNAPSFAGVSFSPYNVRAEIEAQKRKRTEPDENAGR